MNNDLYFIDLISRAIFKPHPKSAIKEAFGQIIRLGKRPEYERGFAQFQQFMNAAYENLGKELPWLKGIWDLYDKKYMDHTGIDSVNQINEAAETLFAKTLKDQPEELALELIVNRNEKEIVSFSLATPCLKVENAAPGLYSFCLNTSRCLWAGAITEKDLLWTAAYPESDVMLAADTQDFKPQLTRKIVLIPGEIVARIFPGFENGLIEIKIKALN